MKQCKAIFLWMFICVATVAFSQEKKQLKEVRSLVREGNKEYNHLKFDAAEIAYKKALDKSLNYPKAVYNLANALYQQARNKEALEQYSMVEKMVKKPMMRAEIFHNTGNTMMNEKKYAEAVEAYKESLRNNSKDEETRYNLALAKKMLKDQQKKNKQNKDKNKDQKDKDQKQDKNDQKNQKDNQKKQQDQKKQDQKDKNQQGQKNQNQKDKNKDQKNQKQPTKLSKQQLQQLLEAMNKEENKTQKKMNKKKEKGRKVKREKDW